VRPIRRGGSERSGRSVHGDHPGAGIRHSRPRTRGLVLRVVRPSRWDRSAGRTLARPAAKTWSARRRGAWRPGAGLRDGHTRESTPLAHARKRLIRPEALRPVGPRGCRGHDSGSAPGIVSEGRAGARQVRTSFRGGPALLRKLGAHWAGDQARTAGARSGRGTFCVQGLCRTIEGRASTRAQKPHGGPGSAAPVSCAGAQLRLRVARRRCTSFAADGTQTPGVSRTGPTPLHGRRRRLDGNATSGVGATSPGFAGCARVQLHGRPPGSA